MSAIYWVVKYVEDPFKDETRNVGVIVCLNGAFAARFFGEREDGEIDARKLKGLTYPLVYTQWREFWRRKLNAQDIDAIVRASTSNYFVKSGGEVTETGSDHVADVCHFLYNLIVRQGPVEAFDWADSEDAELDLATDITNALEATHVLANGGQLFTPHPVQKEVPLQGGRVTHRPSFS